MVRYEDPPGKIKHIRFGKISPEIYTALVGYPGVKSIVLHEGGSKGGSYKEHPHYHVWYESEKEITNQTIRNNMKKLPIFASFSGQNDWSFRNHDNWETWASYVCKNKTHKVLLAYRDIDEIAEKVKQEEAMLLLKPEPIEHIKDGQAVVSLPKKSRAQRDLLKTHLIEVFGWKENAEFGIGDYNSARIKCKTRIISWFDGWCDDRDGIRMLRFLLYTFADDELREELSVKISRTWDNYV